MKSPFFAYFHFFFVDSEYDFNGRFDQVNVELANMQLNLTEELANLIEGGTLTRFEILVGLNTKLKVHRANGTRCINQGAMPSF